MTVYHKDDTIRLKAIFKDENGVASDLNGDCTLKIFLDPEETTPTLTRVGAAQGILHPSTGTYVYYYTATTKGQFTYEFSGQANWGNVLDRGKFQVIFA